MKDPLSRNKRNKMNKKTLWKRIALIFMMAAVSIFVLGIVVFAYFASTAPAFSVEKLKDPIPSRVFDRNDELVTTIYQGIEREYIDITDTPELVTDAVLAVEDNRFYEHGAIDFKRLGGAVISNITGGFGSQGASTITQQVVKRAFLTEEKTIKRKAQEAYLSYRLEQEYAKDDILEMYLNKIYYSDGIYGVRTASLYYFDKELDDLNLKEAAYLAGLPNLPNVYNLYVDAEAGNKRANQVLALMLHHGRITEDEYNEGVNTDLTTNLVARSDEERSSTEPKDPQYASYINVVKQQLEQSDEFKNIDISELLSSGIDIYTNMDANIQRTLQNTVNDKDFFYGDKFKSDDFNIASSIIDTQSGALIAISGGRDYQEVVKENLAITQHNTGSTMKPILSYAPAIENMEVPTNYTIQDEYEYSPKHFEGKIYNYDNQGHGTVTIRDALRKSYNIPAVKLFEEVREESGDNVPEQFAKDLGLDYSKKSDGNYTLSFNDVLGGNESRFSPLQMAQAYAAFGNGGTFNEAGAVRYIINSENEQVDMEYESHEAMKDSTAYMITDMLKGTFQPYGSADYINMNGLNIAGKTGTTSYSESMLAEYNLPSNAAKDAWIVGYTPEYTMSVWTGFTSTKKDGATSFVGTQEHITPQWFFQNIMTQISTYNGQDFTMPESVTWVGGQELGVVNSSFQFNPNRIRRYYYEAPEEETEVEEDNTDEEVIDETEPEEPVETPENGDDGSTDNSDTTNPDTDSGE
ncbi:MULTISPECIES: transglycosylase domain-containing protein [Nosocomiicoccus]|uniref:Transglycosylase domain-containing protein n=1 Tax=Nosocomiicoccus massiliensis TaxID=1232430 RepID=A0AAF0YJA5_9STAP|nr:MULTISPECIES: transglycosylase domain-containing protein [Nosocomiicoccus]OFL46140.1 transglycosylase [Nosocomiicoccus sp. HMSC067E10]WOS96551.1 transglycosylase domain-containing protein [Nosocomiicoccus massiliensis]